jgi:hypothetical protein
MRGLACVLFVLLGGCALRSGPMDFWVVKHERAPSKAEWPIPPPASHPDCRAEEQLTGLDRRDRTRVLITVECPDGTVYAFDKFTRKLQSKARY